MNNSLKVLILLANGLQFQILPMIVITHVIMTHQHLIMACKDLILHKLEEEPIAIL
jgi:hypothetical protein